MATLKSLHKALLTLDDGREMEVQRIGRGRYTTAWANGHNVYLQVREGEYSKEIMEGLQGTKHIPECRHEGYIGTCRLYVEDKEIDK